MRMIDQVQEVKQMSGHAIPIKNETNVIPRPCKNLESHQSPKLLPALFSVPVSSI
jgi:hypothetical protein